MAAFSLSHQQLIADNLALFQPTHDDVHVARLSKQNHYLANPPLEDELIRAYNGKSRESMAAFPEGNHDSVTWLGVNKKLQGQLPLASVEHKDTQASLRDIHQLQLNKHTLHKTLPQ